MKRVLFWMTAIALFVGCAKETDKNQDTATNGKVYTITASVDNPETRTVAERFQDASTGSYKYSFKWEDNEQIAVVPTDANTQLLFTLADADFGTFTYEAQGGEPEYAGFGMAVTPANALDALNPSVTGYDIQFSGSYLQGCSNAIMVAGEPTIGSDGNQKFQFKHIAALVKVTYKNVPAGTNAMVFVADQNIKGTFHFTSATGIQASNNAFTTIDDDTPKEAWVILPDALEAPVASMDFYVPIPIGQYQTFQVYLIDEELETVPGSEQSWTASAPFTLNVADVVACPEVTLAEPEPVMRGTLLYKESWDNYSTGDTPSESNNDAFVYGDKKVSYTWSNPADAKVQGGTMYAGGASEPEVIIKKSASLTVAGIPTGFSTELSLYFKSNKGITITSPMEGVTVGELSNTGNDYEATISISGSVNTVTLVFSRGSNEDNTRIDDIVVRAGGPLSEAGIAFPSSSYTAIYEMGFDAPALTNPNNLTVTYSSSEPSVATVDASTGTVTLNAVGSTIISASYPGDGENYSPADVAYTLNVENATLELSEATTPAEAEASAGSTVTFTVTSNLSWTAAKGTDQNGIIDSVTSDGNTVTVTFKKNSDAFEKTAIVTVTPDESALQAAFAKSITVTQKAFENVDILNREWTGVASSSTAYINWQNKVGSSTGNSYSGRSAGNYNSIQVKNGDESGIVSTSSASNDVVEKVVVSWDKNTTTPRGIEVYGKNTPYTAASDLYSEGTRGTLLGTLTKTAANGTAQTAELTSITGEYKYIGLLATGGANYLSEVRIYWTKVDQTAPKISADVASLNWAWNELEDKAINVTVNASEPNSFTVTPSNMDWATVATNGTVITVTPNATNTSTTTNNSGTITLHHDAGTIADVVIDCTQTKAPVHEITVSPSTNPIVLSGTANTAYEITVSSNYAWSASTTGSGFTVSPTSGSAGDVTVTITPTSNGGDAETELGTVTFTDNTVTSVFTVKQAKYEVVATTATLTLSSSKKFGTTSGSTLNDDKGNTWTCTGTSIQNSYNTSYEGQQFGSSKTNNSYSFTATIAGKTITGVSIKAAAGSSTPTYTIKVNGETWKSGALSTTPTTYSATGSASGEVEIILDQNSGGKAVYLGEIVLTY